MTLLDDLTAHSTIVPETAELAVVQQFRAEHVNLSGARITAAAQQPAQKDIVDSAIAWAQKKVGKGGNRKLVAMQAVRRLQVEFADALVGMVAGTVSLEVDGRLAYKRRPTIDRAREIIEQLEERSVDKSRVLLKIPATWEGIEAARKLRDKSDIQCCLTLVFGMHQLAAAADAGAAVISPAVGRISDWHKKKQGIDGFDPEDDPGVKAAIAMHDYLVRHGYETQLMPGMFRGIGQAIALAGCDKLTLPPKLLSLLAQDSGEAAVRVTRQGADDRGADKLEIDNKSFATLHAADELASSKLSSAVQNLSWSVVSQQKQLVDYIAKHQDVAAESSTSTLFQIWDYDGDGFIDREEWNGSDAVFNALDRDNNGRVSLEEMALGLGAPYTPPPEQE